MLLDQHSAGIFYPIFTVIRSHSGVEIPEDVVRIISRKIVKYHGDEEFDFALLFSGRGQIGVDKISMIIDALPAGF